MKFCKLTLVIVAMMCHVAAVSQVWNADILGDGYVFRYVKQPKDYSGDVRCTIVKKTSQKLSNRAVLYIHGYNDYFFQKEMGDRFSVHGYNFYAVDLRKYGRSLLRGQRKFEVRNLDEYYQDIDSAMRNIVRDGNKSIFVMGHSTGGLIAASYMATGQARHCPVKALILNSPFLDMNLSNFQESTLVPVVSVFGKMFSDIDIDQGDSKAYAESLLAKYHGEWNYNTSWKMEVSPAVTSGWLRAIHQGQQLLQSGVNIKVPILLMRSDNSVYGDEWTPAFNKGDCVLDVNDISRYGRLLGSNVRELVVEDGLHDLTLSRKAVRNPLWNYIFKWMSAY